jgi:(2Fe-2S) ferredoxin
LSRHDKTQNRQKPVLPEKIKISQSVVRRLNLKGGNRMTKPKHHIFVCASFRLNGTPQGVCAKGRGPQLLQYLEEELSDRGMADVAVSSTSCLRVCDRGPALVVYPENWWFGRIDSEEAIDAVLDSIGSGVPSPDHVIA